VNNTKDKEGRYFFDRPSLPFENILNSLRTNTTLLIPEKEKDKKGLLKEIEYFGLNEYFQNEINFINGVTNVLVDSKPFFDSKKEQTENSVVYGVEDQLRKNVPKFDKSHSSSNFDFSNDLNSATLNSETKGTVMGEPSDLWCIKLGPNCDLAMIGMATSSLDYKKNSIGGEEDTYFFYTLTGGVYYYRKYNVDFSNGNSDEGTTYGLYYNRKEETVTLFRNGKYLGTPFTNIKDGLEFRPAFEFSNKGASCSFVTPDFQLPKKSFSIQNYVKPKFQQNKGVLITNHYTIQNQKENGYTHAKTEQTNVFCVKLIKNCDSIQIGFTKYINGDTVCLLLIHRESIKTLAHTCTMSQLVVYTPWILKMSHSQIKCVFQEQHMDLSSIINQLKFLKMESQWVFHSIM
jgi:hypothetical protein